ncbi:MAG: thioredoxin family protein [Rhodothermales bacterium]
MMTSEQIEAVRSGLTFDEYMAQWAEKNALPMRGLDPVQRRTRFYSKYNLERQCRVVDLWAASESFSKAVMKAPANSDWLFLTDDWCVDSAYSLPLVHWGAEQRDDLTLRILLKDDHPRIMDAFLTNGKRSIPKFVGLDQEGQTQFVWGPQPDLIRDIRQRLIKSGAEGRIVSSTTVEWYAENGWLEVERELTQVLSAASN